MVPELGSIGASTTKLDPGAPSATSNVGSGAAISLQVCSKDRCLGIAFATIFALMVSDLEDIVKGLTAQDMGWEGGRAGGGGGRSGMGPIIRGKLSQKKFKVSDWN